EPANSVDKGGIRAWLPIVLRSRERHLLGLLRQGERGHGVLAYRLLIFVAQLWISFLDDLTHADLGQFLRNELLVEQSAFEGRLVLNEGRDNLVQIFAANAHRLRALW